MSAALAKTAAAAPAPRFDLSAVKILIADDNPRALDILSQVLLGFSVRNATQCQSIAEAAPILDAHPHDLVIVDGEMPDQDGFDLTHHIRSHPEGPNFTTPILIVSGYTPIEKILRARDVGANAVVTKPIVPGVLLNRIERLARKPRQFVASQAYCGPDRRFRESTPPGGEERRVEAVRAAAAPERPPSQKDDDPNFS